MLERPSDARRAPLLEPFANRVFAAGRFVFWEGRPEKQFVGDRVVKSGEIEMGNPTKASVEPLLNAVQIFPVADPPILKKENAVGIAVWLITEYIFGKDFLTLATYFLGKRIRQGLEDNLVFHREQRNRPLETRRFRHINSRGRGGFIAPADQPTVEIMKI